MSQSTGPSASGAISSEKTSTRGAPGRVAAVHRTTRIGLGVAMGFVIAAVVLAVAIDGPGWWVPLHLFVVGGLLSAVSAVTQMLAVTWSSSPAPTLLVAGLQRWTLAVGAIALVVGHASGVIWLFVSGAIAVISSMLGLAAILLWVRRGAVTRRYAPAIEAYVAAILLGAVGMSIGLSLGSGLVDDHYSQMRNTHLVLNVFGFVGLVIAGTLPFFAATQVRAKMARGATPTLMRSTFGGLAGATVVGADGALLGRPVVMAVGLIAYAVGLIVVAMLLSVYSRARVKWAGPRVFQLLAGLGWWAAMAVALAVVHLQGSGDRVVLQALVIGGFGQILVASLAYLGPVLRGGGHKRLSAGFALTRSWVSLAAGNLAPVAILANWRLPAVLALLAWTLDVATRVVLLVRPIRRVPHGARS